MTGTDVIPTIAWEQAVYVCLFIVLIIVLINWFSRQSDKWQNFIEASNEKWRQFNKEQREDNNGCMADVNKGLTNLTQVTQGLVLEVREMREESRQISADLQDHDLQAKEILTHVQNNGKTIAKPRARVNGEGVK